MGSYKKKLIEVALPLEAINKASAREKSIRHGHPSTLHLWWARRPLAAARAVIFAQMVDDPSAHPERFPTEEAQERERQRLFRLIEDLVKWENTTNETVLAQAREEIWKSWRITCSENRDHPRAAELFNPDKLPAFHDPFAGGGALPLEAQRLGLESYASDLNPVAVLINKAMIEIPPKFAGRAPVNPDWQSASPEEKVLRFWRGAQGLAEDVRYYGKWMRDEAEKRIGHLYPKIEITAELAKERPDLKPLVGRKLTVIAWLWARTVKSPNPAFAHVDVPLASTFILSSKPGREAYVQPVIEGDRYRLTVKIGTPPPEAGNGTKAKGRGANFRCLISNVPISPDYIRSEAMEGRLREKLICVVAEVPGGRIFLSPSVVDETVAHSAQPLWQPEIKFFQDALGFRIGNYGMTKWSDLFSRRQLVAMSSFCDLATTVRDKIRNDALAVGFVDDELGLENDGFGAVAYAEAVSVYLSFAISRASDYWGRGAIWESSGLFIAHVFTRNALPMTWDYPEANPFSSGSGSWSQTCIDWIHRYLQNVIEQLPGYAQQADAQSQGISAHKVVSTDPPYYDNIGYADLSDYFYMWLRPALRTCFPTLLSTISVPKSEELVATPERHGSKRKAEDFFLSGMTLAMHRLANQAHPSFPVTIYYAFKQAETDSGAGTSSTGWETFLEAVLKAGFSLVGTWPMRTERPGRMRDNASNALASSIVLVCRPRPQDAPVTTRRDFLKVLKCELPDALKKLQHGNIAPVDLAQAAIGPGTAIFTRYAKVLESDDSPMKVRTALQLINEALDEYLSAQEGEYDVDTRFAITWFETHGMEEGPYGVAETLATARGVSVSGVQQAGILQAKGGKVRLLKREEMPHNWDPATDTRLTVWEAAQHLIRIMETKGEAAAGELITKLGSMGEIARDLAYRLYGICEKKKWADEALAYNGLVIAWPELTRLAAQVSIRTPSQADLAF